MKDGYITEHFDIKQLTRSDTASKKGIKNKPTPEALANLKFLCVYVLQPLRDKIKAPIIITSGYRGKELNALVGGVPGSQHETGEAVDITAKGYTHEQLAAEIFELGLPVDQVIVEYDQNVLHVSVKGPRGQYLSRDIKAKKIVYSAFDPSSVRRKSTKALKLGSSRKRSKKGKVRKSTKSKASRA